MKPLETPLPTPLHIATNQGPGAAEEFVVCALPTFMRAFNKQFHTQMTFESVYS